MTTLSTGVATEFISFTRASNATVTDSNGLIEWAAHNLLLGSEQFDTWPKGANVSIAANSAVAPNGTSTADKLSTSSGTDAAANEINRSVAEVGTYTMGIWMRALTPQTVRLKLLGGSGATLVTQTDVAVTTSWTLFSISGTTATTNTIIQIRPAGAALTDIELWGAHLYRSDMGMQANTSAYPMYNPTTPKNLLGFTENFENAAWTVTNATKTATNTLGPNGLSNALTLTKTADSNYSLRQNLSSFNASNKVATVSAWLRGTGTCALYMDNNTNQEFTQSVTLSSTWTRHSVSGTFNSTSGNTTCGIRLPSGSASSVEVAQFQISDSASLDPYTPNHFTAPSAAAYYGPRRDFDSAGVCRGLLVEEQRTNLLLRSDEFNNVSSWTPGNVTITPDAIAAPSGASTADSILETAITDIHRIYEVGATVVSGTSYTWSVYVKANGRSIVQLICGATAVVYTAEFDISAVTTTNRSGTGTATIAAVGGGWYRITATAAATASGSGFFQFSLCSAANTTSYLGDITKGAYLWGAQVEAGSFATSYIPTTTASATRNADVAQVGTAAFPYSQTEGTLVWNYSAFGQSNTSGRVVALGLGGSNSYGIFPIVTSSTQNQMYIRDISGDAIGGTLYTANQSINKGAAAYKANDFAVASNGSIAITASSGAVPSQTDVLRLGRAINTDSSFLNGHIRQITYLPRRISNTELQTRTA